MHPLQEPHRGLEKELQHEGEHNGENDRAGHVERGQDGQREKTSEKERLRIDGSGISAASATSVDSGFGSDGPASWTGDKGGAAVAERETSFEFRDIKGGCVPEFLLRHVDREARRAGKVDPDSWEWRSFLAHT